MAKKDNQEKKDKELEELKNKFKETLKRDKQNKENKPPQTTMSRLLLFLFMGAIIFSVWSFFDSGEKEYYEISYTEYRQLLNQDIIKSAKIYKESVNDYQFKGILKSSVTLKIQGQERQVKKFSVRIALINPDVEKEWQDKDISFSYEDGNNTWQNILWGILPWVFFIGVYIMFFRWMSNRAGGRGDKEVFSFGKSKARLENNKSVTFNDVAGCDEAKEELWEVVDFLKAPEKYQVLGGKIPRGVLLLGPPGTGKTLLARAVSGEADVPFYSISGADFVEMFVGVGASRVRDLFDKAKKNSPCIVFIDEIDAVGRQRGAGVGGGHDEREQTLNQLLVEMDGFEQNSGVIVIAATNRSDVLDAALLRPGRFDRQIVVDRPDIKGRIGIFKVHSDKVKLGADVDLEILAKGTPGLSGADIANIVNEAALLAARRSAAEINMLDFENAKDKVLMGVERKSIIIPVKEKEMTAYHEMGHALVGYYLPNADPIHKVTIIPRGMALGLTSFLPQEDKRSHTRDYILTNIAMMLGGRAAERIIYDNLTTGASNDIQRATALATKMVCEWGMSDKVGPIAYSSPDEEVFLGRDISRRKTHSEQMAQVIDAEISRILDESQKTAERILTEHIDILHRTAKILVERETLESEELQMLIEGKELPPISPSKMRALRSVHIDKTIGDKKESKKEENEN